MAAFCSTRLVRGYSLLMAEKFGPQAFAAERHEHILRLLAQDGRVRTVDLARDLRVAEPTVRKDVAELAERGLLRRTYGGAIAVAGRPEPTIETRSATNVEAKARIAEAALSMIQPGESVYLDNGTTVLALASALVDPALAGSRNVNVLTNGIEIAQTVVDVAGIHHVLLGGTYRAAGKAMTGPLTLDSLAQFSISTTFIGVSGLRDGWFTVADLAEAQVKNAVIKMAGRVVVMMDASKIGISDFARICPLSAISTLIVDRADDDLRSQAARAGVEVLTP